MGKRQPPPPPTTTTRYLMGPIFCRSSFFLALHIPYISFSLPPHRYYLDGLNLAIAVLLAEIVVTVV